MINEDIDLYEYGDADVSIIPIVTTIAWLTQMYLAN